MCSWCWAYRPTLDRLREELPATVEWRNRLGGLAPDSSEPMPEKTRHMVQGHWQNIQQQLGTEFNYDFWTDCQPRRSTYEACRAVLAASGQDMEEQMILSIQKAYYLRAMNPSNIETLVNLAGELGMNEELFKETLLSKKTDVELQAQITQVQKWPVSGFPSLVLKTGNSVRALVLDYRDHRTTLDAIPC
jgi:putative protein-disulfide isomerase